MTPELFLAKVNKVTAYHRHGQAIPKRALDDLANAQLEMEEHGWAIGNPQAVLLAKLVAAYENEQNRDFRTFTETWRTVYAELKSQPLPVKLGTDLLPLYQQALNRIDDYLEYQYLNDRPDAMKVRIMCIIDDLTDQLKAGGKQPEVLSCPECRADNPEAHINDPALWNKFWTHCPWCGRKVK